MVTKGEREWGRDKLGVWDQHIQTTIYKIDKQQGPTAQCKELYSISCNKTIMGKNMKKNIYIYIYIYIYIHIYTHTYKAESLCCTPETNTTL